jgi:hypothetical protein
MCGGGAVRKRHRRDCRQEQYSTNQLRRRHSRPPIRAPAASMRAPEKCRAKRPRLGWPQQV